MGPDAAEDADVDMLVARINAWQLYSRMISDPTKLKSKVLAVGKQKAQEPPPTTPQKSRSNEARSFRPSDECAFCHKKGHWKRDCPELEVKKAEEAKKSSTYKPSSRRAKVVKPTSSSSSSSDSDSSDSEVEVAKTFGQSIPHTVRLTRSPPGRGRRKAIR